jgi:hypothetical protein
MLLTAEYERLITKLSENLLEQDVCWLQSNEFDMKHLWNDVGSYGRVETCSMVPRKIVSSILLGESHVRTTTEMLGSFVQDCCSSIMICAICLPLAIAQSGHVES